MKSLAELNAIKEKVLKEKTEAATKSGEIKVPQNEKEYKEIVEK